MARRGLFLAGVDARSRADDDSAGPVHLPESGARSLAVARDRRRRDLSRDDARDAPDVSERARMGGDWFLWASLVYPSFYFGLSFYLDLEGRRVAS